jgi:RNA polymerase sigma factor (sigma-70 family)
MQSHLQKQAWSHTPASDTGITHSDYEALLGAAKSGESAAFERLTERSVPRVFHMLCRITKNREDAEDALQDALLRAFINLHTFDERSSFSTWLTRIAINAALMILRKRRLHRELPMDGPGEPGSNDWHWDMEDSAPNPEKRCAQQEKERTLIAAVSELRPTIRKTVELRHFQEHSMQETADILGISVAAAKGRLFHARSALRKSRRLRPFTELRNARTTSRYAQSAVAGRQSGRAA